MSRGIVESTLLPSYSNTWQSSRFPEQHRRYHHSSPNFSLQPTNNNPGRSVIRRFLFHDLFEKRSPCSLAADDVIVSGSSLGVHPESKAPCVPIGIRSLTLLAALERRWMILALAPITDRVCFTLAIKNHALQFANDAGFWGLIEA